MKHAIACLNTQIGILIHNASVFHGEGREEDRDRNIAEADDLRMAVEALKDEIPLSERMGSGIEPRYPKFTGTHTPSAPDTLTLEVGKRYVRRDGKITGPLTDNTGDFRDFVFLDPDSGETYQTDGLSGFGDDLEWREDIVAEYVEPQSAPWEESAKQFSRDADFYRGIVTRIGELYGDAAKRCDDGTISQDVLALVVPELVETSVNQFRLLASFVGSKATSHTEIVSDAAAEIRALRTSLEAERYRTAEAVRKLEKFRMDYDAKAAEVVGLRGQEQEYRMLEIGEVTQDGDEVKPAGGQWCRLEMEHLGWRINPRETGHFPVGYYRRPISLDTKPENPDTPAA